MSVESYLRALPKVELHLQLEGAVPRETMLMFADQNEIREEVKRFDRWLGLYANPDFKKLGELVDMLRTWLRYGDDLTRAVYDIGVTLSKDNVRYAEIGVNPLTFVSNDFTFEALLNALNDGRDRAERAWGVQMRWIMLIPRSEPRRADEIARWATSATARKNGVVGVALMGYSQNTSLDQFERAFRTAQKKNLARAAYLGSKDDIDEAIDLLKLDEVIDGWGLAESPETVAKMADQGVTLSIGLKRARAYGWIREWTDYPLNTLWDAGVQLTASSDMPVLFDSHLSDEFITMLEHDMATLEQIEQIAANAVDSCHLPDEEKETLKMIISLEMDVLRDQHLTSAEEDETTP
jgi:adenosine deaminase